MLRSMCKGRVRLSIARSAYKDKRCRILSKENVPYKQGPSRNVIASVVGRQPTAINRSLVLMSDACQFIGHHRWPGLTTNAG